jgi:hypothetical protein
VGAITVTSATFCDGESAREDEWAWTGSHESAFLPGECLGFRSATFVSRKHPAGAAAAAAAATVPSLHSQGTYAGLLIGDCDSNVIVATECNNVIHRFSSVALQEEVAWPAFSSNSSRETRSWTGFRPLNRASTREKLTFHGRKCARTDMGTALDPLLRTKASGSRVFRLLVDCGRVGELHFAVLDCTKAGEGAAFYVSVASQAVGALLFTVLECT